MLISSKIQHLRKTRFFSRHRGAIQHDLVEIEREVIALEIENYDLRTANLELVREANRGKVDEEIPF